MMRWASYFIAGVLFSAGLVIAGMTQPSKVIGFLDVFGSWDPSLAFVMGGAIAVHAISYRLIQGKKSPLLAPSFQIPTKREIDGKLLLGAGLFGAGWGLAGYCPGPAISSAVVGDSSTLIFLATLLSTMFLYSVLTGRVSGTANRNKVDHELGEPHVFDVRRPASSKG